MMRGQNQKVERNVLVTWTHEEVGAQKIRINSTKLHEMLIQPEIGEKPIAFIGITGCMRTGKSFILNYILRYLRKKGWDNEDWMGDGNSKADKDKDIEWKRGSDRNTTGIRIFNEKFEVPIENGKTMIVMILDTQGLFDFETSEQVNKAILTLSTMICSVQIFNVVGQINAQHLHNLEVCVDFARESAKEHNDDAFLRLQRLMILIRDYPEEGESYFTLCHGKQKLDEILTSNKGGKQQVEVRRKIRSTFAQTDCYPLPFPGEKVTKRTFEGTNKDLKDEFRNAVKSFVEEIAHPSKLIPKQARSGRYLTAREVLLMIAGCDKLFAEKMFKAALMVQENIESYYAAASQETILEYRKTMESWRASITDERILKRTHSNTKKTILPRYQATSEYCKDIKDRYKKDIEDEIQKYYDDELKVLRSNQKVKDLEMESKITSTLQKYQTFLLEEISKATVTSTLEQIHENALRTFISSGLPKLVSVEIMTKRATAHLEENRDLFEKKLREGIQAKKDARKDKLYRLVQVELLRECFEMWEKYLHRYCSITELEKWKEDIEKKIITKFWKAVVNCMEYKYIPLLYTEIGAKKEKVRYEAGWQTAPSPVSDREPAPGEENYAEKLNELVGKFAEELRLEIKNHTSDSDEYRSREEELTKEYEKKFYAFCDPTLDSSVDKLDEILCNEYEAAKDKRNKLWIQFTENVDAVVTTIVATHEQKLAQEMTDLHIKESELHEYYSEAIEGAKEGVQNAIQIILSLYDDAKRYFEDVLKENMDKSLKNVLQKNLKAREHKQLRDFPAPRPRKRDFMKKIFGHGGTN